MDQFTAVVETVTLGVSGIAFLALVVDEVAQFFPRRGRGTQGVVASQRARVRRETRNWGLQGKPSEVPAV